MYAVLCGGFVVYCCVKIYMYVVYIYKLLFWFCAGDFEWLLDCPSIVVAFLRGGVRQAFKHGKDASPVQARSGMLLAAAAHSTCKTNFMDP